LRIGGLLASGSFPSGRAMRSFLHFDFDVGSGHADTVARDGSRCRRTDDLTCPNVEYCTVPRTGDLMARDLSLGQGPASVRARVVEREELAVDIKQGDRLAFDVAQSRLAGLDFVCLRYLHKVSHGSFLPSTRFPRAALERGDVRDVTGRAHRARDLGFRVVRSPPAGTA